MEKEFSYISKSPDETIEFGKSFIKKLKPSIIIGLDGNLGTGKTHLVKGFALGLGIKDTITSPTFLGINEYNSSKIKLIHMDFYHKVFHKTIIEKYLKEPSIIVIEWSKNYSDIYNEDLNTDIQISLNFLNEENSRNIKVKQESA